MEVKSHHEELKFLNEFLEFSAKEIFKGKELYDIVLTFKPQRGSYGFCTRQEVFTDDQLKYLEISYNINCLDRGLEKIFDTLLHEQIHDYCRKVDIKEVSSNGKYHNNKFKELCDEIGLKAEKCGTAGWNTVGSLSEELNTLIDEKFLSKYKPEYIEKLFGLKNLVTDFASAGTKGKDRNYKKYVCPICGQTVRAKANANIICGDCMKKMEEQ